MAHDPPTDWRELGEIQLTPILGAALQVFSEQGYHGATVRAIASRAGVTVPLLYYHHKNKQGLLVDLFLTAYANVESRIKQARADADNDALCDFSNLIEAIVIHTAGHVPFTQINSSLRYVEKSEREPIIKIRQQIEQQIVETISRGVDAGLFVVEDPPAAARALAGLCNAIATWYRPGGPKAPQQIAVDYVAIALRIVGYQPVAAQTRA